MEDEWKKLGVETEDKWRKLIKNAHLKPLTIWQIKEILDHTCNYYTCANPECRRKLEEWSKE